MSDEERDDYESDAKAGDWSEFPTLKSQPSTHK